MIVKDKDVVPFGPALYEAQCECGAKLSWEALFDADGTNYRAECCRKVYWMRPHTVTIAVEAAAEED